MPYPTGGEKKPNFVTQLVNLTHLPQNLPSSLPRWLYHFYLSGSILAPSSSPFKSTISMAFFRLYSPSPFKSFNFSVSLLSTVSSADIFYDNLLKNSGNVEKSLALASASMRTKLDSRCISEVLCKCSNEKSQIGLRFFIWAGHQPNYRHSSFMYSRACEILGINRNPSLIFRVIEDYRRDGCFVDIRMFKVILTLCKEANLAFEALFMLRKMPEFHLRPDTIMYNLVIRLLIKKSEMDRAMELMEEMNSIDLYPDMITYVAILKGLCGVGRLEDACKLFKTMKETGCTPNAVAYSVLLDGACKHGIMEKTMELLEEMEIEGGNCSPNAVTYTSIIQKLCEIGRLPEALKILDRMQNYGCAPNRVTVCTLIKELCKQGEMGDVYKLFDRIVAGGGVSYGDCYSPLLMELVKMKKIKVAEDLFRYMLASGVKPDSGACNLMIKELCSEDRFLDAYRLYIEVDKSGYFFSIDSDLYSLLLVGLCDQDHSVDALNYARLMVERGIRLNHQHADRVIKHLKKFGDQDLLLRLGGTQN